MNRSAVRLVGGLIGSSTVLSGVTYPESVFAVVIPAFNDERSVATAVRSALDEGTVEQVIVVDDGSSDQTCDAARSIDDKRLLVLQQENLGPGAARNAGAMAASAGHLLFLDSDDRLISGSLAGLARAHRNGASLARSGAIHARSADRHRTVLAEPSAWPFPRGTPLAGTFSMSKVLFDSIGGYDDSFTYGENSELLFRAQRALDCVDCGTECIGQPTVHVTSNDQRQSDYYRAGRIRSIELMLEKHGADLRKDRATYHNHHAIAAVLYRQEGRRQKSLQHAFEAVRADPGRLRSWLRLAQSFATQPNILNSM